MIYIAGIILSIIVAGFFAGIETGLLAANQLSLISKKENKVIYARIAHYLLIKPERLLSTTLIGTNITVVSGAVMLKSFFSGLGLPFWVPVAASLLFSMALLIFAEVIPKSFFRDHADTISVRLSPVLGFFYLIFLPLSLVFNVVIKAILFIFRQKKIKRLPGSREDLKLLIKLIHRESGAEYFNQRIIDDIFDFKETMAREVMIPFHKVPVIAIQRSIKELVILSENLNARFLFVYLERTDNVKGYVDVMDLVTSHARSIHDIMKQVSFYPDTKLVPDLLRIMIKRSQQVILLSDEYGGISGMISQHEIARELVRYLPREESSAVLDIKTVKKNIFNVSGTTDLEDLYNETGIRIGKGVYDTIGGYLTLISGEIPEKGAIIKDKNYTYVILESDERYIKRIEIRKIRKDEG